MLPLGALVVLSCDVGLVKAVVAERPAPLLALGVADTTALPLLLFVSGLVVGTEELILSFASGVAVVIEGLLFLFGAGVAAGT